MGCREVDFKNNKSTELPASSTRGEEREKINNKKSKRIYHKTYILIYVSSINKIA
jgi:hypothetical protein